MKRLVTSAALVVVSLGLTGMAQAGGGGDHGGGSHGGGSFHSSGTHYSSGGHSGHYGSSHSTNHFNSSSQSHWGWQSYCKPYGRGYCISSYNCPTWSYSCWNASYGCYLYYDSLSCNWFYFCPRGNCYYSVNECPYGTYSF